MALLEKGIMRGYFWKMKNVGERHSMQMKFTYSECTGLKESTVDKNLTIVCTYVTTIIVKKISAISKSSLLPSSHHS